MASPGDVQFVRRRLFVASRRRVAAWVSVFVVAALVLGAALVPIGQASVAGPRTNATFSTLRIGSLQEPDSLNPNVGVLTAAAIHGAAHQQPQEFQVVTTLKQRPVTLGRERIRFVKKRKLTRTGVMPIKTPTGTMLVSTPEATALDLLRYPDAAGFLSNIATVLRDLAPKCDPVKLVEAASSVELPHVQRLGHLLDRAGARRLADPLADSLAERRPDWAPLDPAQRSHKATRDKRWRLLANTRVELDA